jgi:hypothetical protein
MVNAIALQLHDKLTENHVWGFQNETARFKLDAGVAGRGIGWNHSPGLGGDVRMVRSGNRRVATRGPAAFWSCAILAGRGASRSRLAGREAATVMYSNPTGFRRVSRVSRAAILFAIGNPGKGRLSKRRGGSAKTQCGGHRKSGAPDAALPRWKSGGF